MARSFTDQVIIVTGASSGIGRALCLELARERPRLVLAARSQERLAEVARECERLGASCHIVRTDVNERDDCRRLVSETIAKWGQLDVLVANAGRAMWSRFDEIDDLAVIEEVMRTNYLGSVYCTNYALPHLKKSGGLIVAMSSVSGLSGVPMLSGYAASKHAVLGFFESLRIELDGTGVGITIAAPDFVRSEILVRALDGHGRAMETSPLDESKFLTAEKCARRIVRAMHRRERLVLMTARSRNLRWGKLLVPRFVDRMVAGSVRGS